MFVGLDSVLLGQFMREAIWFRDGDDPRPGRAAVILLLRQGIPEQQTHDYIHHFITSLFAAQEVGTGKITADACYPRHTNVEFLAFLKLVAKAHWRLRLCG